MINMNYNTHYNKGVYIIMTIGLILFISTIIKMSTYMNVKESKEVSQIEMLLNEMN